jgi:hypothetical protein
VRPIVRWARLHPREALVVGFVLFVFFLAKSPDVGFAIGFVEFLAVLLYVLAAVARWIVSMSAVDAGRILRDHIDAARQGADNEATRRSTGSVDEIGVAYAVLGVDQSATDADVRRAHHTLVRRLHPDLHAGVSAAQRGSAEERLKLINAAHTLIVKSRRRTLVA